MMLGMRGVEADSAAAQFARTTGRVIDVLFQDGLVVAVGTVVSTRDQLVNMFGAARVVREGHDKLALIFASGLVAEVRQTQAGDSTVTYLAVQATSSMAVPAIGNFAPWIEGVTDGVAVAYLPIQSENSMSASGISHLSQWSDEPAEGAIVPGRSIGPVALGMSIQKAREAASIFGKQTRCSIDLLAAHEVVIAAGTPWAACLNLQLPYQTAAPIVVIGSPPAVLADMYGIPWVVQLGADRSAHVFTNGLVAHVGVLHVRGGFVTYLAVQPRGWRTVPTIGHFIDRSEALVAKR
ncbi:MAG TPA: hypothetical protein VKT83_06365 [bacterium]|nr:hypothetical protein [bacterium]